MVNYHLPLQAGGCYHIFNRGNNWENLFPWEHNYAYFLRKYAFYMGPYVDTYAYCLLPNHFHLAIRVKTYAEIRDHPGFKNLDGLSQQTVSELVSHQFKLFFMSYAKALNKQSARIGSLFQKNFKRIRVDNDQDLKQLILFIHLNPYLHDLQQNFRSWKYSSYKAHLVQQSTKLCREEVMLLFEGKEAFVAAHHESVRFDRMDKLMYNDA